MKKPDNFDPNELDIKKSNLSNISNNLNKKQSEGYVKGKISSELNFNNDKLKEEMNMLKNNLNNLDIKKNDKISDKVEKDKVINEPKIDKKIVASSENKKLVSEIKDNSKPEVKSKPVLSKNTSNQSSNVGNNNQNIDKNKPNDIKDFLKDAREKNKKNDKINENEIFVPGKIKYSQNSTEDNSKKSEYKEISSHSGNLNINNRQINNNVIKTNLGDHYFDEYTPYNCSDNMKNLSSFKKGNVSSNNYNVNSNKNDEFENYVVTKNNKNIDKFNDKYKKYLDSNNQYEKNMNNNSNNYNYNENEINNSNNKNNNTNSYLNMFENFDDDDSTCINDAYKAEKEALSRGKDLGIKEELYINQEINFEDFIFPSDINVCKEDDIEIEERKKQLENKLTKKVFKDVYEVIKDKAQFTNYSYNTEQLSQHIKKELHIYNKEILQLACDYIPEFYSIIASEYMKKN